MNLWAAVVGGAAVGGLLCAWRFRRLVPIVLLVGVPLSAIAALRGLATDVISGVLVVLLGVPYWGVFLVLYMLGAAGGGERRPSVGDG